VNEIISSKLRSSCSQNLSLEAYRQALAKNSRAPNFRVRVLRLLALALAVLSALTYSEFTFRSRIQSFSTECQEFQMGINQSPSVWQVLEKWPSRREGQVRVLASSPQKNRALLLLPDLPWLSIEEGAILRVAGETRNLCLAGDLKDWERSYLNYLAYQDIRSFMMANKPELIVSGIGVDTPRDRLLSKLAGKKPHVSRGKGLVLSATLGDVGLLDSETRELFRRLGLSHLLVVSGFHLGVAYLLFEGIFRFFFRRTKWLYRLGPIQVFSALAGWIVSIAYVLFVGGSVSTVRALLMLTLVVLARIYQTNLLTWKPIIFSAVAVMLLWPGSHRQAGPQLVFAALGGIVIALKYVEPFLWKLVEAGQDEDESEVEGSPSESRQGKRPPKKWSLKKLGFSKRKLRENIASLALVSLFAFLTTAPVVRFHFGSFVPFQPFYSFLITPIFSFGCLWLGLLGLILFQASGFDGLLELSSWLAEGLVRMLEKLP